jgi:hypothetical protein
MAKKTYRPTREQDHLMWELSRRIPEGLLLTRLSAQVGVGDITRKQGMLGVIALLFHDPEASTDDRYGSVVAWEDGSITIGGAIVKYLARMEK